MTATENRPCSSTNDHPLDNHWNSDATGFFNHPLGAASYPATIDNVKYVYVTVPPVAGDNPLTGPFYIKGAAAGDTLAVHCGRSKQY